MKYIYIFLLVLSACSIDPVPGKVEISIDTDSKDYIATVYCDDKKLVIEYPMDSRKITSWDTDEWSYSYTVENNDLEATYFTGRIRIVYPDEYDVRYIYFSD